MQRTAGNYKRSILTNKTDFDKIFGEINFFHSSRREALMKELEKHEKHLHQILAFHQPKKYDNDNTNAMESNMPSLFNNFTENDNLGIKY